MKESDYNNGLFGFNNTENLIKVIKTLFFVFGFLFKLLRITSEEIEENKSISSVSMHGMCHVHMD